MKKTRKRKMLVAFGGLLVLVGMILIWFHIPYSPLKRTFQKGIHALMSENRLQTNNEVFMEDDFKGLPTAVQK